MDSKRIILIVDDEEINRKILNKILSEEYTVLETANGQEALYCLKQNEGSISGIILDIVMPVMDGYTFLQIMQKDPSYRSIPVIVSTGNNDNANEIKALENGAWDFVSKPYNPKILLFRLKNAIERSLLSSLKQLKYLTEFDTLTGLYKKQKFYRKTEEVFKKYPDRKFVFLRFDVDRFQLVNTFFGMEEGDKVLKYIADFLRKIAGNRKDVTYSRIESDIFCFCMPYTNDNAVLSLVKEIKKVLTAYNSNYDMVPSFGIYCVEENDTSMETIYNNATLAAKKCKSNYIDSYAFYTSDLSAELVKEQEIINEMNTALEQNQFKIYLQPKYNLRSVHPDGAEALVRWDHPEKGLIPPNDFIPVFERNGFISRLDHYVWEAVCQLIREWMDRDIPLFPISVNVSRVDFYNPRIVEDLIGLVEKYEVPISLFQLELTESAYSDNPVAMREIIKKLRNYGFIILMDDFGSGYSSLSILKDISVDLLKLDMQFLSETEIEGRGENIIASIIRMAKWLNIPVVVEGAENRDQVVFLRSIGCDYVQGYYFARPMAIEKYEELIRKNEQFQPALTSNKESIFNDEVLFCKNPQLEMFFSEMFQAVVIYEFDGKNVQLLRVNEGYYSLFGIEDMAIREDRPIHSVIPEYQERLLDSFRNVSKSKDGSECEFLRKKRDGTEIWIHVKLKYIESVGDTCLIFGVLHDITAQKEIEVQ